MKFWLNKIVITNKINNGKNISIRLNITSFCFSYDLFDINGTSDEVEDKIIKFAMNTIIPAVCTQIPYNSADNSLPKIGIIKKLINLSKRRDNPNIMFGLV